MEAATSIIRDGIAVSAAKKVVANLN
jgi:hypothetical protein